MILLERSENLIRPLLLLMLLISVILLCHVHFSEMLQLPLFIPKNDSKQKLYKDDSIWNRKKKGLVEICSAREWGRKNHFLFPLLPLQLFLRLILIAKMEISRTRGIRNNKEFLLSLVYS